MNIKEWRQNLIEHGMCEKVEQQWTEKATVQDVMDIAMSLDGMTFIAENEYPKPHQIALFFHGMAEDNGLFIKKITPIDIIFPHMKVHIIDCYTEVNVDDNYIGYIFVSGKSDIVLNVGKKCDIYLNIFDGSFVEVKNPYNSSVNIKKRKVLCR